MFLEHDQLLETQFYGWATFLCVSNYTGRNYHIVGNFRWCKFKPTSTLANTMTGRSINKMLRRKCELNK